MGNPGNKKTLTALGNGNQRVFQGLPRLMGKWLLNFINE
jgi:hypothetical protein